MPTKFPTEASYVKALRVPGSVLPGYVLETKLEGGVRRPSWRKRSRSLTLRLSNGSDTKLAKLYLRGSPRKVRSRLSAIHKAVDRLSKALPAVLPFDYLADGVKLEDGSSWPVLLMPFVASVTLEESLAALVARKDGAALQRLAGNLGSLFVALEQRGVSHGDIDIDNILVEASGALRLVDFDSLYSKETAHLGASEAGKPNFCSPRRKAQWGAWIDRFSHWLLYASVLALSLDQGLWGLKEGRQELLFVSQDFIGKGTRISVMKRSGDSAVREIAGLLERLWALPFDEHLDPLALPASYTEPSIESWARCALGRKARQSLPEYVMRPQAKSPKRGPAVRTCRAGEEIEWWKRGPRSTRFAAGVDAVDTVRERR